MSTRYLAVKVSVRQVLSGFAGCFVPESVGDE